jgi:two-component system LytT family response regulator
MPGISGIDLIRSFPNPTFRVVFVTAFDAYAIEALRLSAIDYLLKPVEAEEIVRVIEKIKNETQKNENLLGARLQQLEKILARSTDAESLKIGIGMADKIVFVNIADIIYCKAEGAYTHAYMNDGKKIVASRSLGEFEKQLAAHNFFRIHHSILVNLHHVKEFQRFNGGYVIMVNNAKLEVSHRKRNDFMEAIEGFMI